jgi:arylsulfatase A-like enzyme
VGADWPRAAAGLAAIAVLAAACPGPRRASHVLLISVDSLRPDHLGSYGYPRPTSPRIDELARQGTLFERALSSTSWTLPAHAALFTGLADSLHGVARDSLALSPALPTLATALRQAGFATGAVVSGPYLHPRYGLANGFDDYLNCMGFLDDAFQPRPGPRLNIHLDSHADTTTPCVVDRARDWLRAHAAGPAFLFLHFWDVHYDYQPPRGYAERFDPDYAGGLDASQYEFNPAVHKDMLPRDLQHLLALYDGEVAYTDEGIGALLDLLRELGIAERTLVVLVADHGEAFFEHGRKGHQKDLHGEVVRIPLILRGPGVPRGLRHPGPAHITDVAPTILALQGVAWPAAGPVGQGMSLTPALRDPRALAGRWLLSELRSSHLVALESLELKLVKNLSSGKRVAYDLRTDAGEQRALPASGAGLAELEDRLARLERLAAGRSGARPDPAAPELLERLRALGYVK